MSTPIRFAGRNAEFFSTLRNRINSYFEENNIKPTGNWKLYSKTIILGLTLGGCYAGIMLLSDSTAWVYGLFALMGITFALIGFNVMHDGAHGSYSSKPWVNKIMANSLNLLGGNSFNWAEKHNFNHHSYTNIDGVDDDIDLWPILRVNPTQKKLWFHKFQHIYVIPAYAIAYLAWIFYQDFTKYFAHGIGDAKFKNDRSAFQHFEFWGAKVVYLAVFLVVPIFILGPLTAILGYLTMALTTGMVITIVFQLAHVVEGVTFVTDKIEAKNNNKVIESIVVEDDWATHQLKTTANFSTKSKFLTWALGGLNFQVEHHLFPKISHIHYPKINEIVKNTCAEFGIPYQENDTFISAVRSHFMHLKEVGQLA